MFCIFDELVDDIVMVLFSSGDVVLDLDFICGNEDVYLIELEIIDDG